MKLMGIDVGTTGVKVAVFDECGIMLGYGFQHYSVFLSKDNHVEQDAEVVWERTKDAMACAVLASGGDISAISLSVQGDAIIPIGSDHIALCNCILGMDYRSEDQTRLCVQLLGDRELYRITGMRPHPMNSLTKVMWFRQNRPDLNDTVYKYTTYADFILLKLGVNEPVIDLTMASRFMALDSSNKRWSNRILDTIAIDSELLSRPCPSAQIVGIIDKLLASELGISQKAKIVSGGHDQTCAAFGAGIIGDEFTALDSHGTAEVVSTAFRTVKNSDAMYKGFFPCTLYVIDGYYFTFALNHTGGILFQWLRDVICEKDIDRANELGIDPYTYLIDKAPEEPSKVLVLPHFNGSGTPICDLESKGAFIGLSLKTTREDLVKAVLDSLTYEMKQNICFLREVGIEINKLRCVGGAAKSDKWMQIKADILGIEIETLSIRESACLGAAMLAGIAEGVFSSAQEASSIVKVKRCFVPNEEKNYLYDKKYHTYSQLYGALRSINHDL